MSSDSNGATINPHAAPAVAECPQANGRRGAHKFIWLWAAGTMTDKVKCATCGEVRMNDCASNATILKPTATTEQGESNDPVQPTE